MQNSPGTAPLAVFTPSAVSASERMLGAVESRIAGPGVNAAPRSLQFADRLLGGYQWALDFEQRGNAAPQPYSYTSGGDAMSWVFPTPWFERPEAEGAASARARAKARPSASAAPAAAPAPVLTQVAAAPGVPAAPAPAVPAPAIAVVSEREMPAQAMPVVSAPETRREAAKPGREGADEPVRAPARAAAPSVAAPSVAAPSVAAPSVAAPPSSPAPVLAAEPSSAAVPAAAIPGVVSTAVQTAPAAAPEGTPIPSVAVETATAVSEPAAAVSAPAAVAGERAAMVSATAAEPSAAPILAPTTAPATVSAGAGTEAPRAVALSGSMAPSLAAAQPSTAGRAAPEDSTAPVLSAAAPTLSAAAPAPVTPGASAPVETALRVRDLLGPMPLPAPQGAPAQGNPARSAGVPPMGRAFGHLQWADRQLLREAPQRALQAEASGGLPEDAFAAPRPGVAMPFISGFAEAPAGRASLPPAAPVRAPAPTLVTPPAAIAPSAPISVALAAAPATTTLVNAPAVHTPAVSALPPVVSAPALGAPAASPPVASEAARVSASSPGELGVASAPQRTPALQAGPAAALAGAMTAEARPSALVPQPSIETNAARAALTTGVRLSPGLFSGGPLATSAPSAPAGIGGGAPQDVPPGSWTSPQRQAPLAIGMAPAPALSPVQRLTERLLSTMAGVQASQDAQVRSLPTLRPFAERMVGLTTLPPLRAAEQSAAAASLSQAAPAPRAASTLAPVGSLDSAVRLAAAPAMPMLTAVDAAAVRQKPTAEPRSAAVAPALKAVATPPLSPLSLVRSEGAAPMATAASAPTAVLAGGAPSASSVLPAGAAVSDAPPSAASAAAVGDVIAAGTMGSAAGETPLMASLLAALRPGSLGASSELLSTLVGARAAGLTADFIEPQLLVALTGGAMTPAQAAMLAGGPMRSRQTLSPLLQQLFATSHQGPQSPQNPETGEPATLARAFGGSLPLLSAAAVEGPSGPRAAAAAAAAGVINAPRGQAVIPSASAPTPAPALRESSVAAQVMATGGVGPLSAAAQAFAAPGAGMTTPGSAPRPPGDAPPSGETRALPDARLSLPWTVLRLFPDAARALAEAMDHGGAGTLAVDSSGQPAGRYAELLATQRPLLSGLFGDGARVSVAATQGASAQAGERARPAPRAALADPAMNAGVSAGMAGAAPASAALAALTAGGVDSVQRSGAPSFDSAQRGGAPSFDSAQRSAAPSVEQVGAPMAAETPAWLGRLGGMEALAGLLNLPGVLAELSGATGEAAGASLNIDNAYLSIGQRNMPLLTSLPGLAHLASAAVSRREAPGGQTSLAGQAAPGTTGAQPAAAAAPGAASQVAALRAAAARGDLPLGVRLELASLASSEGRWKIPAHLRAAVAAAGSESATLWAGLSAEMTVISGDGGRREAQTPAAAPAVAAAPPRGSEVALTMLRGGAGASERQGSDESGAAPPGPGVSAAQADLIAAVRNQAVRDGGGGDRITLGDLTLINVAGGQQRIAASTEPASADFTQRPPATVGGMDRPVGEDLSNFKRMLPQVIDHIHEILKKKRNQESRR